MVEERGEVHAIPVMEKTLCASWNELRVEMLEGDKKRRLAEQSQCRVMLLQLQRVD